MSSDDHGIGGVMGQAVRDTRELVGREVEPAETGDLFEPLSSEEMLEARSRVGPNASNFAVYQDAKAARAGRPKGAKNKRTDDLVAYLSQFGPDPAVAAMRIIAETEELMIQRSRDAGDGKRKMTFGEARAARMRMIELMAPYFHGKKPIQVDMSFSGLSDLIIAGQTHSAEEVDDILEAEFVDIDQGGGDGS